MYPAEIEQIMADHPAVNDVAVIPMQHPIHQDVPICAVALHADQTEEEAELLTYGRKRLGASAPRAVFVVDTIPRNLLGKLIRKEMATILSQRLKRHQWT
jgi:acyl-coenzyme A synthetase/AMP-(fatty) acid ligase